MNTKISQEAIHTLYRDLNNLLKGNQRMGFTNNYYSASTNGIRAEGRDSSLITETEA